MIEPALLKIEDFYYTYRSLRYPQCGDCNIVANCAEFDDQDRDRRRITRLVARGAGLPYEQDAELDYPVAAQKAGKLVDALLPLVSGRSINGRTIRPAPLCWEHNGIDIVTEEPNHTRRAWDVMATNKPGNRKNNWYIQKRQKLERNAALFNFTGQIQVLSLELQRLTALAYPDALGRFFEEEAQEQRSPADLYDATNRILVRGLCNDIVNNGGDLLISPPPGLVLGMEIMLKEGFSRYFTGKRGFSPL